MSAAVTRFAPSPTGYLHLGHAHSALFAWQKAKELGGVCLLRIENIDTTRCKDEHIAAIEEDLSWLGLDWPKPVRVQARHMPDYAAALARLTDAGLMYPCFCTRKEIEAEAAAAGHAPHQGPDGPIYPGTCRHLGVEECLERIQQGTQHSWRLDMEQAVAEAGPLQWRDAKRGVINARPQDFGDVILARKDCMTSYHLSVTVDDAIQEVTCVTRGDDLLRATDIHVLLQKLLGLPQPAYHHHGMLMNEQGERLSKRDKALALRDLRAAGETPEIVRMRAGFPKQPGRA